MVGVMTMLDPSGTSTPEDVSTSAGVAPSAEGVMAIL
jgi:hypothetical protein